jgi:hypothetical protein
MIIVDLMRSSIAALPRLPEYDYLPSAIQAWGDAFAHEVASLSGTDPLTLEVRANAHVVSAAAHSVFEAATAYFLGYPDQAYAILAQYLNSNSTILQRTYSKPVDPNYLKSLYRVRTRECGVFSRHEMFHIPFDMRQRVRPQRYSITGFPSLYLGSSIYICWQEMGEPQLDQLNVVRVVPTRELRVLDFGYPPHRTAELAEGYLSTGPGYPNTPLKDWLVAQVLLWPVKMACSIRRKHDKADFHPEYVVPHLVLQYVRQDRTHAIDGIRYFSMQTDTADHHLGVHSNFVFPVKTSAPAGLCMELCGLFHVSPVVAWQIAKVTHSPMNLQHVADADMHMIEGLSTTYRTTAFGQMEGRLQMLTTSPL